MGILAVEHVTKRYGEVVAVDQVSLEAHPGRILGLLGPNGAGKTSTIRMIAYITIPDEGRVLYDGQPVGAWSQQRMGYLPEERGLYKKMKVGEQLLYFAALKGMSPTDARQQVTYWLERFGAPAWFGKKTEELSKGMQQKVQFILSILHRPSLIILDEPFSGLDPINADLLEEVILELKAQGCTILFASHRMEQVEQICDDICLISKGQIVLQGSVREVKRRYGRNTVLLDFEGRDGFLDRLEQEGRVRVSMRSHTHAELHLHDGTTPRQVLEAALAHADTISRFELMEPPLKEIFVQVVGEQEAAERIVSSQEG
jgi:ABC-2 type transport system ATP-binding protein